MSVTITAALVNPSVPDQISPPGHAGWNNSAGDPNWIPDIDWYRRVQVEATGTSVGTTVNWEFYDTSTVPFKTMAEIDATTTGTVASPFGPFVNNIQTWTVWVTTGSSTAGQAKYRDSGSRAVSTLRANGPQVQVLLGDAGQPGRDWKVAAFLPGAGRLPSATVDFTSGPPVEDPPQADPPDPDPDE